MATDRFVRMDVTGLRTDAIEERDLWATGESSLGIRQDAGERNIMLAITPACREEK